MPTFGITANGFVKKTLANIVDDYRAAYRLAFGNSINLNPPSLMATQIGIAAEREAAIWDLAEECWNSRAASTAQGVSLDNVGELTNNERLPATQSIVTSQLLFGNPGTVVPTSAIFAVSGNPQAQFQPATPSILGTGVDAVQHLAFSLVPTSGTWTLTFGALVTSALAFNANAAAIQAAINLLSGFEGVTVGGDYTAGFDLTFSGTSGKQPQTLVAPSSSLLATSTPVTIASSTTTAGVAQATANMVAIASGPTVAQTGTLTVINTPITGLSRTTNSVDAILGRLVETDGAYRIRRKNELQKAGASTVEAIRTQLKQVAGVLEAIVFQNTTLTTDGDGRPGKSIAAFVDGGVDQDIGNQLWKSVAGGIQTFGTTTVTVVDSQGLSQTIQFSRPVKKPVYIIFDVVTDPSVFPSTGSDDIKAAAVAYGNGLAIGESVLVYPKLLPAVVDRVVGITNFHVKIGFAPSPTLDSNLTFAANERAQFDTANITVNIT